MLITPNRRKMIGRNQLKTLSDVLKFLMVQNRDMLKAQAGKPPIARCIDCKRDITAMEMFAACPKCASGAVCYECVDKHDHLNLHDFLNNMLN
jgi:Zn finger protein HypA/HybF involved in hydrogenase expression